ncbi:MAG TPA: hypothetical protein VLB80_03435 [Candidatus Babeliales bacterium]|nr:hypothetical protein [Candidatus Babeliales bacterium]
MKIIKKIICFLSLYVGVYNAASISQDDINQLLCQGEAFIIYETSEYLHERLPTDLTLQMHKGAINGMRYAVHYNKFSDLKTRLLYQPFYIVVDKVASDCVETIVDLEPIKNLTNNTSEEFKNFCKENATIMISALVIEGLDKYKATIDKSHLYQIDRSFSDSALEHILNESINYFILKPYVIKRLGDNYILTSFLEAINTIYVIPCIKSVISSPFK